MKLSKKFTTVTPLSKFIAMALFVIFPFVGFYLGINYQKKTYRVNNSTVVQSVKEIYPECIASLCPTFTSTDVTGRHHEETVIRIPTAMTQGAGKIIIMADGKKIFDSGEMAGIGFEQLPEGNGFILKYSSPLDENFHRTNYEIRYIWENGQFIEQVTQKQIEKIVNQFENYQKEQNGQKTMSLFAPPSNKTEKDNYDFIMGVDFGAKTPRLFSTAGLGYHVLSYQIVSITQSEKTISVEVKETRKLWSNIAGTYTEASTSRIIELTKNNNKLLIERYYLGGNSDKTGKYDGILY